MSPNRKKLNRLFLALFFISSSVFMLFISMPGRALAANIIVNSTDDNTTNGDGKCTLREAITAANNNANFNDCIGTGTYGNDTITFSVTGIIMLSSTLPNISGDLTINGPGASNLTISGQTTVGVMIVDSGFTLNLQNLTIANGNTNNGGGVQNNGALNVANCTFSGNSAFEGGGILNNGTLKVTDSTFFKNTSRVSESGAGIKNTGTAEVTNSTFSGNIAGSGAGIANTGTLTVTNCTFSGNTAIDGGGITNSSGTTTVTNCTFSGNDGEDFGCAIFTSGGTTTLQNTVIANSARCATITLNPNCSDIFTGKTIDGGFNIVDDNSCNLSAANNSQPNTNPLLDPAGLQNNGGPTQTIGLCAGAGTPMGCTGTSPAIDKGSNSICAAPPVNNLDQRGFVRPVDGPDADSTATCDIGAFEFGAVPPVINSLITFVPIRSTYMTNPVSLRCLLKGLSGGEFDFSARLTNISTSSLTDLMIQVATLTNGNKVLLPDGSAGGVGATFAVPNAGGFTDGVLSPNEFVDVPFVICLTSRSPFNFIVNVLGLVQ